MSDVISVESNDGIANEQAYRSIKYSFLALFIFISLVLFSLALLVDEQQQYTAITEEKLISAEVQTLQVAYLTESINLSGFILSNNTAAGYITTHTALSDIYKKLALISFTPQSIPQQLFSKDKTIKKHAARIEEHFNRNQTIKALAIKQLSSIMIMLDKEPVQLERSADFIQLKQKAKALLFILESLNIHSLVGEVDKLQGSMHDIYTSPLMLAANIQQEKANNTLSFENQLLQFEKFMKAEGFIAKWRGHLRLISEYHQVLSENQQEARSLLNKLTVQAIDNKKSNSSGYAKYNLTSISVFIGLGLILIIVATLLVFILQLMQARMNEIELGMSKRLSSNIPKKLACMGSDNKLLTQQYKTLQEKFVEMKNDLDETSLAFERLQSTSAESLKYQFTVHQKNNEKLLTLVLSQLQLLADISASNLDSPVNSNVMEIYEKSTLLITRLKEANSHSYLQRDEATLFLNDVDLVTELQTTFINQSSAILKCNNNLTLVVNKDIQVAVKLDSELFSEMMRIFIQLLLVEQQNVVATIHVALQDINEGQQRLCFNGEVKTVKSKNKAKLPKLLQHIHNGNSHKAESELLNYFYTLLKYQHGESVSVSLTEQGYQLSFVLPLAVMLKHERLEDSHITINPVSISKNHITLEKKYKIQPVEVLLAVKNPESSQFLLQLLRQLGLQVFLVTRQASQTREWESGRYTILITEFTQSPFVAFRQDLNVSSEYLCGVFSMGHKFTPAKDKSFASWNVAEIQKNVSKKDDINEILTVLSPWLQGELRVEAKEVISEFEETPLRTNYEEKAFLDIDQFILNQGSAELAMFMMNDYITETTRLMDEFTQSIEKENVGEVNDIINALLLNAKILAATDLIQYCHHWKSFLSSKNQGNDNAVLKTKLLSKIQQEVANITHYAQMI